MKSDAHEFLPLQPAALHILLALAREPLHGYGIMQEVARESDGRFKLGPGTLYDNIQRLLDQGLVDEVEGEGDSRRRYYRLSRGGVAVLSAEVSRLESIVRSARAHLKQHLRRA